MNIEVTIKFKFSFKKVFPLNIASYIVNGHIRNAIENLLPAYWTMQVVERKVNGVILEGTYE